MTMPEDNIDARESGWRRFVPRLVSRLWTVLLGLSLMANLLIGGLILGHRFGSGGPDRFANTNMIQLVPRSFLMELPRDRRRELLKIVREGMKEIGGIRAGSSALALKLADVIEKPELNSVELSAAIDAFATGNESIAAKSAVLSKNVLTKLSPEERTLLATAIRERAQRMVRK